MAKVLIIESDAAVARELGDALKGKGVEVQICADGTEGLDIAKKVHPGLIVLCVELSRGSGYSVCNKLKKDPELAAIPLILTSSQATDETFEQHKKLRTRAEEYIKKPYVLSDIVKLTAKYLKLTGGAPVASAPAAAPAKAAAPSESEFEVSLDDFSVEAAPRAPVARAAPAAATFDVNVDPDDDILAPIAKPAPKPVVKPAPAPAAARTDGGSAVSSTSTSTLRRGSTVGPSPANVEEMHKLRGRIQELEKALEQKDLEFNDRLLAESARGKDGLEAKKKLQTIERDVAKHEQAAKVAKAEVERAKAELANVRASVASGDTEREALAEKMSQLVEKVKSLAAERDQVKAELEKIRQEKDEMMSSDAAIRDKAKKAVDIAVQLLGETGLVNTQN